MRTGRPTKLTDELRDKADGYLDWAIQNKLVPSSVNLARYLGISKSTLYKWADEDADFSDTVRDVQTAQEDTLIYNGLNNNFNASITKLLLTNHGYSDTSKVDHTTKGKELPTPILGATSRQDEE